MTEGIVLSVIVALLLGLLAAVLVYGILWIVARFTGTQLVDDLTARRAAGILGALVFILVLLDRLT